MQTFLPFEDFTESAKVLDYRRLGRQRVEAYQILRTLQGRNGGWEHHPATLMWKGYEQALKFYLNCCLIEWVSRGYANAIPLMGFRSRIILPWWLGDEAFHAAHRSNLLRKHPIHYSNFGWTELDNLPYLWPKGKDYEPRVEAQVGNGST